MPTQTSQLRLEATGTDKTAAMFESVRGQLQQTSNQIKQLSKPTLDAKKGLNGVGGALQNIAAFAGGGPVASAIGQVKGLANAVGGLGVSMKAAMPLIGVAVAAWKAYEYAQRKVRRAQDEAKKSAEELAAVQKKAAKSVVAAYDRVLAKTKEARAAQDALVAAQRERSAAADKAWDTRIETEGLQRMLAAQTEEERAAIAKEVAQAVASSRHEAASRVASEAAASALTEINRNEADIAKLTQERESARKIGAGSEAIQRISDAIEAAERRRAVLQQKYANAQAAQRQVEADWQKEQLQRQLEAQREIEKAAEEAARKREAIEARLADLREKREAEISAARGRAIESTNKWFADVMAGRMNANMSGAQVQSAADVARAIALTSGPNAQFRRSANGLQMIGGGMSKEDQARMKTQHFQDELLKLVSDINRKYDDAENAVAEEI